MESCLKSMLTSTITVKSVTGYSEYGDETLGNARSVKAYVEQRVEVVKHPSGGEERRVKTVIVTEEAISVDDRIWMEGADTSSPTFSRRPESVIAYKHPVTALVDHYEVTL